jgi:hypothetical protein
MLKASLEMMASELVSLTMVLHHRDAHPDHEAKTVKGGNLHLDLVGQKTTAFRRLRVSEREARREARSAAKREVKKEARREVKKEARREAKSAAKIEATRETTRETKMRLTNRVNHVVAVEAAAVAVVVDGVLISVLRKKVVLKPVLRTVKIFLATVGIWTGNDMRGKGRRPQSQLQRVNHRMRRTVISGKS